MGKKILLADDSITIQKVIELTFSDEDFDVVTVGNGRLAIERVQEVRPDVVLCDIIMPEKDGYEVCDFIKKTPSLAHVPVLLLTGAFEPFDQERAARVGCDGYLAKPFEPQTLIAKVKDLLAQGSARRVPGRPAVSAPPAVVAPAAVPPRPAPAPAAAPPTPSPTTPHTSPGFAPMPRQASPTPIVPPAAPAALRPAPAPVPVASAPARGSEYEAFYPTPEEIEPLTASPEFEPVFAPSDFEPVEAYTQEFEPVDPDQPPVSVGPGVDPDGLAHVAAPPAEPPTWDALEPEAEALPTFIPEDPLSTPEPDAAVPVPEPVPPAWAAEPFEIEPVGGFEPVDEAPTGPHALRDDTTAETTAIAWSEPVFEPEPATAPAQELPLAFQVEPEVAPVDPTPRSEAVVPVPVDELPSFEEAFDEPAPVQTQPAPLSPSPASYEAYDPGAFDPSAFEPAAFEAPAEAADAGRSAPVPAPSAEPDWPAAEPVAFEPTSYEPVDDAAPAPAGQAVADVQPADAAFEPGAFEPISLEPEVAPTGVADTAVFAVADFAPAPAALEEPAASDEAATLEELPEFEPAPLEANPWEAADTLAPAPGPDAEAGPAAPLESELLDDEPTPLLEALEDEAEAVEQQAWEPADETLPGRTAAPSFEGLEAVPEALAARPDDVADAPLLDELDELTTDGPALEHELEPGRTGQTLPLSGVDVAAALAAAAGGGSLPAAYDDPQRLASQFVPQATAAPVSERVVHDVPPAPVPPTIQEELSFEDVGGMPPAPATATHASEAAAVSVPVDMVEQIARRVVAQLSEKVLREIAWEVVPELAEALIKKEIERIRAEMDALP